MTLYHLKEAIALKSSDDTMTVAEINELLSLPPAHRGNKGSKPGEHRGGTKPGEQHGRAKLTENDVREIRRVAELGERGWRERLATKYGVHTRTIQSIVNRRKWKHVE